MNKICIVYTVQLQISKETHKLTYVYHVFFEQDEQDLYRIYIRYNYKYRKKHKLTYVYHVYIR